LGADIGVLDAEKHGTGGRFGEIIQRSWQSRGRRGEVFNSCLIGLETGRRRKSVAAGSVGSPDIGGGHSDIHNGHYQGAVLAGQ